MDTFGNTKKIFWQKKRHERVGGSWTTQKDFRALPEEGMSVLYLCFTVLIMYQALDAGGCEGRGWN